MRSNRSSSILLHPLGAALALILPSLSTTIRADGPPTVTVTNCNDSGAGSLRDAYFNAVEDEIIDLRGLACSTITLTTGALKAPTAVDDLKFLGPGAAKLTIDGGNHDRVIFHKGVGSLEMHDLTIANGSYVGGSYRGGGCIFTRGTAYLYNVVVSSCTVSHADYVEVRGGGIDALFGLRLVRTVVTGNEVLVPQGKGRGGGAWTGGTAGVFYSTISDNVVTCADSLPCTGGGLFATYFASILASTISGNHAGTGGGVYLHYAGSIVDSTISGNRASGVGGGVVAANNTIIGDATIANNYTALGLGSGVYFSSTSGLTLYGTIVSGNTTQPGFPQIDVGGKAGTAVDGSNNIIRTSILTVPPDTSTADPMLGPLQFNGGPTKTLALLPGSPAIDKGIALQRPYPVSYDQRGSLFRRPTGTAPDIGAFEFGAGDEVFGNGFELE